MIRQRLRRSASYALLVSLAACQDFPVGPNPNIGDGITQPQGGPRLAETGFSCTLSRPAVTDGGAFQSRHRDVYFDASELSPDGATLRYAYMMADRTRWARSADCVIPRTESAIRRMDRLLRVDRTEAAWSLQYRALQTNRAMGCVGDGMCTVDGLTVTAPPGPAREPMENPILGEYDNWWNGGATHGAGGWQSGGDADGDGDYFDEGPITFALCVAGSMGATGWVSVGMTASAAWQLWGAHVDTNAKYERWQEYHSMLQDPWPTEYNGALDIHYENDYNDARTAERYLLVTLGLASATSAASVISAMAACAPTAVAPI